MIDSTLKIENISKRFRDTWALRDLSLDVQGGEIFGLLGPNGAGKTTTIKLLTGLLSPTEGRVLITGKDITKNGDDCKRKIALIPDAPYLYKKLTGWEFMMFISRIYNIKRAHLEREIDRQLNIFGIASVSFDLIQSYSHGMRQRLLFASVMLRDPEIIILDEPLVGLDPEAARMVKDMLVQLSKKNKTIFLSTHTLSDAQELCDRIAILNKGKKLAEGSFENLKTTGSPVSDNLEDIYLRIIRNA